MIIPTITKEIVMQFKKKLVMQIALAGMVASGMNAFAENSFGSWVRNTKAPEKSTGIVDLPKAAATVEVQPEPVETTTQVVAQAPSTAVQVQAPPVAAVVPSITLSAQQQAFVPQALSGQAEAQIKQGGQELSINMIAAMNGEFAAANKSAGLASVSDPIAQLNILSISSGLQMMKMAAVQGDPEEMKTYIAFYNQSVGCINSMQNPQATAVAANIVNKFTQDSRIGGLLSSVAIVGSNYIDKCV